MHAWCAFSGDQADRDPICMAGLYNKEMGYLFGCMLGQAPKCLTARWTPKDVYFRNAMRVKPPVSWPSQNKSTPPTSCSPSGRTISQERAFLQVDASAETFTKHTFQTACSTVLQVNAVAEGGYKAQNTGRRFVRSATRRRPRMFTKHIRSGQSSPPIFEVRT